MVMKKILIALALLLTGIASGSACTGISFLAEDGGYGNERIWCVVIGIFICCWIFVGLRKLTIINGIVCALFLAFFVIMR